MGTSCVALSIKNIKTRASREMTSQQKWGERCQALECGRARYLPSLIALLHYLLLYYLYMVPQEDSHYMYMATWVPAPTQSCFLVNLNCYLYYYTCTHNWLRNKHLSIYQYSLTRCSSETRSFCLVLLLDEVRSSSLGKMSYCIGIWAGINGPPQKL